MHLYIKSEHLTEGTVLSRLSHPVFYCKACTQLVSKERKSLKCYGYCFNVCFPAHVMSLFIINDHTLVPTDAHVHAVRLSDPLHLYTERKASFARAQPTAAVILLYQRVRG